MPKVVRLRQAEGAESVSDELLAARAVQDREAFGLLYDRYVVRIYQYCYRRLGSHEAAEDATSLVFLRALAALPTHRGPSFRSWLFTIAHHVVLNTRRDAPLERPLEFALAVADAGPSPEDAATASERRRTVHEALALLPDEQRRVVELRLAGLTGPEVAATLGRSHDAVRSTQRRALADIRRLLNSSTVPKEGRHAS